MTRKKITTEETVIPQTFSKKDFRRFKNE